MNSHADRPGGSCVRASQLRAAPRQSYQTSASALEFQGLREEEENVCAAVVIARRLEMGAMRGHERELVPEAGDWLHVAVIPPK